MNDLDLTFQDGQDLKAIYFPDASELRVGETVDRLMICMENGQMALVPWVCAIKGPNVIAKYNVATLTGVELLS